MATQTLNLVSNNDDGDESFVAVTIIVEAEGNTLTALTAIDADGVEYDVRFELTGKSEPPSVQCCTPLATGGMKCEPGPCRPDH